MTELSSLRASSTISQFLGQLSYGPSVFLAEKARRQGERRHAVLRPPVDLVGGCPPSHWDTPLPVDPLGALLVLILALDWVTLPVDHSVRPQSRGLSRRFVSPSKQLEHKGPDATTTNSPGSTPTTCPTHSHSLSLTMGSPWYFTGPSLGHSELDYRRREP